jgi:anti-anti-sigma regulatory factor
MLIDFRTRETGEDALRVSVTGDFGPDAPPDSMFRALAAAIEASPARLVEIDLSGLVWLTLEGLGALVSLKRHVDGLGRTLRIVDASEQAAKALERSGLASWFES